MLLGRRSRVRAEQGVDNWGCLPQGPESPQLQVYTHAYTDTAVFPLHVVDKI